MVRRLLPLMAIALLLCAVVPLVGAHEVVVASTPPLDVGTVKLEETIELCFEAEFSGSYGSTAIIAVSYNPSGWSYEGFSAEMDGVDVSGQFEVDMRDNMVELSAPSLTPANGTLKVSVSFKASEGGDYEFSWSYTFVAMPPPGPNVPDLKMDSGETRVSVEAPTPTPPPGPGISLVWVGAGVLAVAVLVALAALLVRRR